MRGRVPYGASATLAALFLASCGSASASKFEWATVLPPGDGYSLTITALDPLAGTPIPRGQPVTFTVTMNYVLESDPKGLIALVMQDENHQPLVVGQPQAKHEIERGSGTVTLTDTVTIKHPAKLVEMFVVLIPGSKKPIDPAVILRWPTVKSKKQ